MAAAARHPAVLDPLLPALIGEWRDFFGPDLVGVYLCGSAVAGGFDARHSDLDLVVVCGPEAAEIDLARLDRVHQRFATRYPDWAERMDFVYVGRESLASQRTDGGMVATISHDEPLRLWPGAGWVLTWYQLQQDHVVLIGPPVEELFGPITRVDFLHALRRHVVELGERRLPSEPAGAVAYRMLTLARALSTFASGRDSTKDEGAEYARARYPAYSAAIGEALRVRRLHGRTEFAEQLRGAAGELIDRLTDDARAVSVEETLLNHGR